MSLAPGTVIGPYEVVSNVGADGMGECIWRDRRLQRNVALKILPAIFASDPERLARFQRDAQFLTSLQSSSYRADSRLRREQLAHPPSF